MSGNRWRAMAGTWWLLIPAALTAVVFYPITRNYFYADDLLSVYDVVNKPLLELLLVPYGGHLYVVRNGVYALLFAAFGPDPHAYYWIALVTHVLNTLLLAWLIREVTDSARLACFGAALWGTMPAGEATIGWYSVYGHALATLALLVILLGIVRAARSGRVSPGALAVAPVLIFSAATCFGVGLSFAVALPIAAWLLLPPGPARRRILTVLGATAIAVPVIYFAAQWVAIEVLGAPRRAVSPLIIFEHPFAIAHLVAGMAAYGAEQVVLGPFAHFLGLPWAALVAVPLAAAVLLAFWRAAPATRRAMAAFLLLMLGTYGVIALGRVPFYNFNHQLIMRSDRYHYAAPMLLTVVICLSLAQIRAPALSARARTAVLGAALAGLAVALAVARKPILHFDFARKLANEALASMHETIARTPPGEAVYIENRVFRGVGPFVLAAPQNFPGWAGLFVVFHPSNVVDGRRVYFIEPDPVVRDAAERGVRSAGLLIAPEDVPPDRRPPPAQDGPSPASR